MEKKISLFRAAWKDAWQALPNTNLGFGLSVFIGGPTGGIFIGNDIWQRILGGLAGATISYVTILFITFSIYRLWITPKRQSNIATYEFIKHNANLFSALLTNPLKRKHLEIFDILQLLTKMECDATDSLIGRRKFSLLECEHIRQHLSQETHIQIIRNSRQYTPKELAERIHKRTEKSGLKIANDIPSPKMLEFLIIVRDVLNKHGLGLLDKLASNDKYKSLQNKLSKKIEIFNDDPPDWYIYCLILPSSINYFYLYWNYLPNSERAHIPIKMFNVSEFKKIRNTGNTEMMKDINNMINEEFR